MTPSRCNCSTCHQSACVSLSLHGYGPTTFAPRPLGSGAYEAFQEAIRYAPRMPSAKDYCDAVRDWIAGLLTDRQLRAIMNTPTENPADNHSWMQD